MILKSLPHLSDSSKSTKTAQQDSPTNSSISSKSGIGKGGGKGSTVDAAFINGEMIIGGVNGETTKSGIDDFKKNKKKHKDNLHFVLKTYLMGYMPFCMDDEDGVEAVSICMAKARMDCPPGMLLFDYKQNCIPLLYQAQSQLRNRAESAMKEKYESEFCCFCQYVC